MSVRSEAVVRSLGLLFDQGTHCGLGDAELLDRFLSRSDEGAAHAFEGLVHRHGPMVLDVCTRVLGDPHDAEDAFQATFLVLATRARSIRRQTSVASWLHGVALRVARRARSDAARRRAHERRVAEMSRREVVHEGMGDDGDLRLLHEEVERLPRKYRESVVLCYLEGLTLEAAAGQLGCPVGTLGVRLMRGRQRLKDRLTRRGLARADGLLIAGPAAGRVPVVLPGSLVRSTVGAAVRLASGGAIPLAAAQLTNGVLRSMAMTRLAMVLGGVLVALAGVASFGGALGGPGPHVAGKPASRPAARVTESWIGKKVVTKYSTPLREGDRIVDHDSEFRIYTVDQVDGDRVNLIAGGVSGWVAAADIVPLDRAIDFYTTEIQTNGKNIEARLRRALIWDHQQQRAKAIADLTEAIEIGPPYAVIYAVRGQMFRDESDLDRAIADLDQAIRLDPTLTFAYRIRGGAWFEKDEYDKAIADFSEAIKRDPTNEWSYRERGTARLDRASREREMNVPEQAIADLDEAIRLDPNDAEAYSSRCRAWAWKKDYDKAIADADRAIRLDPQDRDAFVGRGWARLQLGQFSEAIVDLTEAIRLVPNDVLAYSYRGMARARNKEFDGAIADFNECLKLDPQTAGHHSARGLAWFFKGRYDEAIADFDEAIRYNTHAPTARLYRGLARSEKKDYDGAISDFDEVTRLDADQLAEVDPKGVYARLNRGWAWFKKKDYGKAIADFDEAGRIDPNNPDAPQYRAWVWATCPDARFRDARKAVETAERLCKAYDWKLPHYVATLAAAYAEAGDFDAAVRWQTKANALESDEVEKTRGEARLKRHREKKPYRDDDP